MIHMSKWRQRQVKSVERRQNRVVSRFSRELALVMESIVDSVWEHYEKTNHFALPSGNKMFNVTEEFYRQVIISAVESSQYTLKLQDGKKRLSKLPVGIPKVVTNIDQIFRDTRYWPKIIRRSKILTDKLRKEYFGKLKKQFNVIVPLLLRGDVTPKQAKDKMKDVLKATKPRVETIFRTETTNYFTKTQTAFFEDDEDIIGFMFDAVRDSSNTSICRARHGLIYRPKTKLLKENSPALHYNCRSHLIPIANTVQNRKLLSDPSRDPSKKSVPPLPKGWRK